MSNVTFAAPDPASFTGIDQFGLVVTGQHVTGRRVVLECRVAGWDLTAVSADFPDGTSVIMAFLSVFVAIFFLLLLPMIGASLQSLFLLVRKRNVRHRRPAAATLLLPIAT